ncbi:hypothetical protein ACWKWP_06280 [Agromyces soli]
MDEHTGTGEQDEPVEDGSTEASAEARLTGLLLQVRSDVRLGIAGDPGTMLRQRLSDAGFDVDDEGFERLLTEVTR